LWSARIRRGLVAVHRANLSRNLSARLTAELRLRDGAAVRVLARARSAVLAHAAAISRALGALNRIKRYLGAIEITAGAFLVATGIVLLTGTFTRIAGWFYQYVNVPTL